VEKTSRLPQYGCKTACDARYQGSSSWDEIGVLWQHIISTSAWKGTVMLGSYFVYQNVVIAKNRILVTFNVDLQL